MIYACDEHIELALDVAVDEFEVAPVIEKISGAQRAAPTCSYCTQQAVYTVTK
ncbi:CxxH/CxxC protein [Shouchella shacheensis]|uniref:CxxH/CxxC protein n=1 Tax=Shouchella shacheensis TaxID=1649580 RepID=UPI0009EB3DCA|nr:CxxH/CxxC protein [Shouchella shacheensis]